MSLGLTARMAGSAAVVDANISGVPVGAGSALIRLANASAYRQRRDLDRERLPKLHQRPLQFSNFSWNVAGPGSVSPTTCPRVIGVVVG